MKRCIDAGEPCTVRLRSMRHNGELFWNLIHLQPVAVEEQQENDGCESSVLTYVAMHVDITNFVESCAAHSIPNVFNVPEKVLEMQRLRHMQASWAMAAVTPIGA